MSSRRRRRAVALAMLAALVSVVAAVACGVDLDGTPGGDGADGGNPDGSSIDGPNGGDDPTGDAGPGNDGDPGDGGKEAGPNPPCEGPQCVIEISAGGDHTCALTRGGDVYCWGSNADTELGVDTGGKATGPTLVPFVQGATHVAAGGDFGSPPQFSCASLDGGIIECWGNNQYGQLGGGTSIPVDASTYGWQPDSGDAGSPDAGKVLEISLGRLHGCARFENAGVLCWGATNVGQLGRGSVTSVPAAPGPVASPPTVSAVSGGAGVDHTCGITPGNGLACWGNNDKNEADPTQPAGGTVASPLARGDVTGVVQVSSGAKFSCAVLTGGGTSCWGLNTSAQLGRPADAGPTAGPINFPAAQTAEQIAAGLNHACAKVSDGGVWCWGANNKGQVGQQGANSQQVPSTVSIAQAAIMVTAGNSHSCALLTDNSVQCWGSNEARQLGVADAGGPTSFSPITVKVLP